MKEKQFEPGRSNPSSPAPGLAAVNTHNPDEETSEERVKIEKVEKEFEAPEAEREPKKDSPV